ncbi:hypothetical protein [Flavobacterium sp.]|uniref:hypothetical protein n=1 Tax=Flavobacterium sp. TaxID=239 RepID=UPI00121781BC|nr:hypothetical protein [Flavobacterium sp.]RZJ71480.1 MAG: hypothetical protein EOO49_10500 [Flavobacterium sp.]
MATSIFYRSLHITQKINTNLIIAKYAESLLKELKYNEPIYIWLRNRHSSEIRVFNQQTQTERKGLTFIIDIEHHDIAKTLSLIEISVKNFKYLKTKKDDFEKWYTSKPSKLVRLLLNRKIERPDEVQELKGSRMFGYFFQDSVYHIYKWENRKPIEIITLKRIVQFNVMKHDLLSVITSRDSIQVIETQQTSNFEYYPKCNFSKFKLESTWPSSELYSVKMLGQDIIAYEGFWSKKVSLFHVQKNKLILDLEEYLQK